MQNQPIIRSSVKHIHWPAVPDPQSAMAMALLSQLEQSQWFSPQTLVRLQLEQIQRLLRFAAENSRYYQHVLGGTRYSPDQPLTEELFRSIPLLTRDALRDQGELLHIQKLPQDHGKVGKVTTSGSTGKPVTVYKTDLSNLFWSCMNVRDHLWHQRDFSGTAAIIRWVSEEVPADPPLGLKNRGWGGITDKLYFTGGSHVLDIKTDIRQQASWLSRVNANYLLSYPSNLYAVIKEIEEHKLSLPSLKGVISISEPVTDELRELCRRVLGCKIEDSYSTQEGGYFALQCPQHDHYHVQSESVYLEVINDSGQPCRAGEIGRIVVTHLHNFATPLIRYEIGDHAEVGEACDCGRGLPVLKRIMGRTRNLVTTPDGRKYWPTVSSDIFDQVIPV